MVEFSSVFRYRCNLQTYFLKTDVSLSVYLHSSNFICLYHLFERVDCYECCSRASILWSKALGPITSHNNVGYPWHRWWNQFNILWFVIIRMAVHTSRGLLASTFLPMYKTNEKIWITYVVPCKKCHAIISALEGSLHSWNFHVSLCFNLRFLSLY